MKEKLCKCNNCESVMYDENPQIGAIERETEDFDTILPMEFLNDGFESFWGCGNCQTDEYLIDL